MLKYTLILLCSFSLMLSMLAPLIFEVHISEHIELAIFESAKEDAQNNSVLGLEEDSKMLAYISGSTWFYTIQSWYEFNAYLDSYSFGPSSIYVPSTV